MISQTTLAAASRVAERARCRPTPRVVDQDHRLDAEGLVAHPKDDGQQLVSTTTPIVGSNGAEVPQRVT